MSEEEGRRLSDGKLNAGAIFEANRAFTSEMDFEKNSSDTEVLSAALRKALEKESSSSESYDRSDAVSEEENYEQRAKAALDTIYHTVDTRSRNTLYNSKSFTMEDANWLQAHGGRDGTYDYKYGLLVQRETEKMRKAYPPKQKRQEQSAAAFVPKPHAEEADTDDTDEITGRAFSDEESSGSSQGDVLVTRVRTPSRDGSLPESRGANRVQTHYTDAASSNERKAWNRRRGGNEQQEQQRGISRTNYDAPIYGATTSTVQTQDEAASTPSNIKPHEYKMSLHYSEYLLRASFAGAVVGSAVGTGAAFIKAGIDIEVLFKGILLQYAAIGTLVGLGVADLVVPIIYKTYYKIQEFCRRGWEQFDTPTVSKSHERVRHLFLPSTSPLFGMEMRAFFGSQAAGLLAAAYITHMHPVIGEQAGYGIGAIIGAALAMLHDPFLARKFKQCFVKDKVRQIEPRSRSTWHKESRHDVIFHARAYVGAFIGFALIHLVRSKETEDGKIDKVFAKHRLIVTATTTAVAVLAPYFFALLGWMFSSFRYKAPTNIFSYSKPHSYSRSLIDLSFTLRVLSGLITCTTLALSAKKFSGGKEVGKLVHWAGAAAVPLVYPAITALLTYLAQTKPRDLQMEKPAPSPETDLGWWANLPIAAVLGHMVGTSLELLKEKPSDNMTLQFWGIIALTTATFLWPHIREYRGVNHHKSDIDMTLFMRGLAGAWGGMKIGTAIGFFSGTMEQIESVASVNLAPPFILDASNAWGAPTGVLVGAGIGLFLPLLVDGVKAGARTVGKRCCPGWFAAGEIEALDPEDVQLLQQQNML